MFYFKANINNYFKDKNINNYFNLNFLDFQLLNISRIITILHRRPSLNLLRICNCRLLYYLLLSDSRPLVHSKFAAYSNQ